jgi:hypothetical protein
MLTGQLEQLPRHPDKALLGTKGSDIIVIGQGGTVTQA